MVKGNECDSSEWPLALWDFWSRFHTARPQAVIYGVFSSQEHTVQAQSESPLYEILSFKPWAELLKSCSPPALIFDDINVRVPRHKRFENLPPFSWIREHKTHKSNYTNKTIDRTKLSPKQFKHRTLLSESDNSSNQEGKWVISQPKHNDQSITL